MPGCLDIDRHLGQGTDGPKGTKAVSWPTDNKRMHENDGSLQKQHNNKKRNSQADNASGDTVANTKYAAVGRLDVRAAGCMQKMEAERNPEAPQARTRAKAEDDKDKGDQRDSVEVK
ncbi:uncharacterized protein SPSK_05671 [Sporothrix schenckii 1099-18]|uniref:Uncharacterized protein n=1 Tax=Sporothrix schenckii 1099-18 TaxID=1397361 RepID=A0A0F2LU54_SPOSC|nr:uncharacterized protein SPSK_05671 [Sporothrix schenckii 1099-18]KJR80998.1 hypothetical protein SPSK_05671 [Sporothrix schenckii 1099-18]